MTTQAQQGHREQLATRLKQPGLVKAPGVYDGLSALLVEQAGFDCAFLSGGSLAFARFGRPDMGLVTATEVANTVTIIRDRVSIPLIVDMDTGFGNALNVQRTVREFERAGASALQMEDQVSPKRCGHMAGKTVIPAAEMTGKIKAALDARHHDNTLIIARTDALGVHGFEDAMERGQQYVDAGADILFIEAPKNLEQIAAIGTRFGKHLPLVYNLLEGGNSPITCSDDLEPLGYRIALFPVALLHRAIPLMQGTLQTIAKQGSTDSLRDAMYDISATNELLGAPELLATGERYDPEN